MQATYYQYYLTKGASKKMYSVDLRPFLGTYCNWATPVFKAQFAHAGERLYLIHTFGDQYLFLHTLNCALDKHYNGQRTY